MRFFTWYAEHPTDGELQIVVSEEDFAKACLFSPNVAKQMLGRKATPFESFELFLGPLGALKESIRSEASISVDLPMEISQIFEDAFDRQQEFLDEEEPVDLMTSADDEKISRWAVEAWDSHGL